MKDPSNIRRSPSIHGRMRVLRAGDDVPKPRRRPVNLSRWRALEHEQFRALVAAPPDEGRSKGGSRPC